jgi:hypothetical protein
MKTKKLYRTRRRKRTYKHRRNMKGGDRPDLNVLKGINLFNE